MSLYRQVHPLLQPARVRVVCRHLGQLALVLALLLSVPTVFAALSGDQELAWRLLVAAVMPAIAIGACAALPRADRPVQTNEALIVSGLAFMLAAALMTYPLAVSGLPLIDAWFEAVSGVTTTGLSMVSHPETKTGAFLFARAWMQWFGGLGIVVLSLALASGRVADMRRLADAASDEEDLAAGARVHARRALLVYVALTCAGLALVLACGLGLFDALIHTLSAISTGGFAGSADSLASYGRLAQLGLLLVAFCGALPLPLFYRSFAVGAHELARDLELRSLVIAVVFAALLLWIVGHLAPTDALLQALTAQTGTGFSTLEVAGLEAQTKWALILSMVTGAGIGSTAGGVKLLRVLILVRVAQLAVLRAQLPRHAVIHPSVGVRPLEPSQIEHALLVILLFHVLILLSWLPFLAMGYPPLDALFDVASATATVGLSTGVTDTALPPGLKLLLTLDMLAGRVEIIALLVLVYPGSWFKR